MFETYKRIRNLNRKDIYLSRIFKAIWRRITNIPHVISFYSPIGFNKENRKRLASFKNIHKDKRCFIIANGPSLKKIDFKLLKDEITIGMNRIYLLQDQNGFMPTYLTCIDEKTQILQFYKEYDNLDIPCFFNFNLRKYFSKKKNQYFIKGKFSMRFSKDLSISSWGNGKSVTYSALQLAFMMGFNEIYLIGKDHSYNTNAPVSSDILSDGNEENHFINGYYKSGQTWGAPDLLSEEHAYKIAKDVFEKNGRIIKDATINGKLNVFDKVDYYSLF